MCSVGECVIHVRDGCDVVSLPSRQVLINIGVQVRQEIDKLLKAGIIVESNAEWCSPLVPICKKDGSVRLCVDYRELIA